MTRREVRYNDVTKQLEFHTHNGWKKISVGTSSGTGDHAVLDNLSWSSASHAGTASSLATFDSAGAATTLSHTTTAAINAIAPLTSKGDVLAHDGTDHVRLGSGSHGQVLTTTTGSTTGLAWTSAAGVTDHTLLTSLNWHQSAHTGTASTIASFSPAGAASYTPLPVPILSGGTGQTTKTPAFDALSPGSFNGDLLVHNGTNNIRLGTGSNGQVLSVATAIPGGLAWTTAGTTDHAALTNLLWISSSHTGTAGTLAYFNGSGQAAHAQIGVDVQGYDADLAAVAALGSTGLVVRSAANTWTTRTFEVTGSGISVANADGASGNPLLAITASLLVSSAMAPPPRPRFTGLGIEWMMGSLTPSSDTLLASTIRYTYHYEEALVQEYDAIVSRNGTAAATASCKWGLYSLNSSDKPKDLLWSSGDTDISGTGTKTSFFVSGTWTTSGSSYKNSSNNLVLSRGQSVIKAVMRNASGSISFASALARPLAVDTAALNTAAFTAFSEARSFGLGFPAVAASSLTEEKANAVIIMALRVV